MPKSSTEHASGSQDARRRSIQGHGAAGIAAVVMAILACYGTLAVAALLPLLGVRLAVNETAWSGTILLFVMLAVVAIAAGIRRHGSLLPAAAAAVGGGLVAYALLVDYRFIVELAGFVALGGAAWRDALLQRRARVVAPH